jgi:hypothetical protein
MLWFYSIANYSFWNVNPNPEIVPSTLIFRAGQSINLLFCNWTAPSLQMHSDVFAVACSARNQQIGLWSVIDTESQSCLRTVASNTIRISIEVVRLIPWPKVAWFKNIKSPKSNHNTNLLHRLKLQEYISRHDTSWSLIAVNRHTSVRSTYQRKLPCCLP